MDNKKEVNIDADGAKVSGAEVRSAGVSKEKLAQIYPEEDPRKFNTRYTEQEVVEYAAKEHLQPITGVESADELIHKAREEKEKPEKAYPKMNVFGLVSQILLTVGSLFFTHYPLFMFIVAFGASVMVMANYRLLAKEYKVLGFNPFRALIVVDAIIMLASIPFLISDVIRGVL